MPMTKVLEQAFREAEWDALVATPESQAFLDKIAEKVSRKKAEER